MKRHIVSILLTVLLLVFVLPTRVNATSRHTDLATAMQDYIEKSMTEREQDMDEAAQIREEAIANGTWGNADSSTADITVHNYLAYSGFFILGCILTWLLCQIRIHRIKQKYVADIKRIKDFIYYVLALTPDYK